MQLKQSRSSYLFVREENFPLVANSLDVNCQDGHQDGDNGDTRHFVIHCGRKGQQEAEGMVPELGSVSRQPLRSEPNKGRG